jgi:hypothetical protein
VNQHPLGRVRRVLAATIAAGALIAMMSGSAAADSSASVLPPEWHIHDGQLGLGSQHKGIGFFPTILGLTSAQYLADPASWASCPNATDKAFLPSFGESASSILRAGVCFNSYATIELRTVPLGTSGPAGWSSILGTDGGAWVTYYMVTYN